MTRIATGRPGHRNPPEDQRADALEGSLDEICLRLSRRQAAPRLRSLYKGPLRVCAMIALCLGSPRSVSTRLLLAQTLLAMKRVRPDVVAEFQERVATLQRDHALPPPAADIVERLINEACAAEGVTE